MLRIDTDNDGLTIFISSSKSDKKVYVSLGSKFGLYDMKTMSFIDSDFSDEEKNLVNDWIYKHEIDILEMLERNMAYTKRLYN